MEPVTYDVDQLIEENNVMVFSKTTCPFCKKVKDLFDDMGIQYKALELNLLGDEGMRIQEELLQKTGQRTVPNVFIGTRHIGGCDSTFKAHREGILSKLVARFGHSFEYDLVVIGGGSGGIAAAKEASSLGSKVLLCDFVEPSPVGTRWGLGGTCVNVGCIPKKLMHQAALLGTSFTDGESFGWQNVKCVHNWEKMVQEVQNYIKSLNWGYRKTLRDSHVKYLNAFAQFVGPHKIQAKDNSNVAKEITANKFIIAVGGRPRYPEIPGAEFGITSDDLFSLKMSPAKTLIIGASYIALECAGFLAGLGLPVTVMVRSVLLRGFDQEIAEMIGEHMSTHGVKFLRECVPVRIEKRKEKPSLEVFGEFKDGTVMQDSYNTVIFAIGRVPCTGKLSLDKVGVAVNPNSGKIIADEREQTSVPYIYAVGDCLDDKPELTPVAIQAGKLLAQRLLTSSTSVTDYEHVPTTVFTPLEYGCVGLSDEAAEEKYGKEAIEVYHSFFQPLEFSLSGRDKNKPYVKLVCLKNKNDKVVGFHYLGPNAGEITQGFALAVKLGAHKSDFDRLIGIHPTCAETFTTLCTTKSSGISAIKTGC